MICCITSITPFVNQATTTIPYSGDKPTLMVSYLIEGVWQALGVVTNQVLTDTEVVIDHGGLSTGIIKVVQ